MSKLLSFLPCIYKSSTLKSSIHIKTSEKVDKSYIVADLNSFLTKNQVESCKKIINRIIKKQKITYATPIQYNLTKTKKSIGSRMGKGKGKIADKVAFVKKNAIIFEFTNLPLNTLKELVNKIKYKLPVSISWKYQFLEPIIYI